jgi:DnaJ-class molecular chaperone
MNMFTSYYGYMSTTHTAETDWAAEMFAGINHEEEAKQMTSAYAAHRDELATASAANAAKKLANSCPRCSGSGKLGFRRANGVCFRCMGSGQVA